MKQYIIRFSAVIAALCFLSALFSGCSSSGNTDTDPSGTGTVKQENTGTTLEEVSLADTSSLPDLASMNAEGALRLTFSDGGISAESAGDGVEIEGTALKIKSSGTYILSGTCADGSVTVAKETTGVFLILDGLNLTSSSGPALTCNKSSSSCIYLAEGSENFLADPSSEHEEGATLKFKSGSALLMAGEGALTVTGNYKNGIKGGAGSVFRILSGTVNVTAANNALACDHSLEIEGGNLTLSAQNDGIKASPDEDDTVSLGNVLIKGGTVTVDAVGDGISAAQYFSLSGGTVFVTTTGEISSSSDDGFAGGFGGQMPGGGRGDGFRPGYGQYTLPEEIPSEDSGGEFLAATQTDSSEDASSKGVKAGVVQITGGVLTVSSTDHALHSSGEAAIEGGTLKLDSSRAKGIATHGDLTVSGDTTNITVSNATEGIESKASFTLNGGMVRVEYASDDGVNLGGTLSSGDIASHALTVNGGYLYCYAEGDGIDSNGTLTVKGGTVAVFGPSNGGNSCLDVQYTSTFNGGTVFAAASSSSMWNEVVGHMSGEYIYNLSAGTSSGNTRVAVYSADGIELYSADCPLQGNIGLYFMTDRVEDLSSCVFQVGEAEVSPNIGTGTGSGGMGGAFPGDPGGGDHGGGPGGMRPGR